MCSALDESSVADERRVSDTRLTAIKSKNLSALAHTEALMERVCEAHLFVGALLRTCVCLFSVHRCACVVERASNTALPTTRCVRCE